MTDVPEELRRRAEEARAAAAETPPRDKRGIPDHLLKRSESKSESVPEPELEPEPGPAPEPMTLTEILKGWVGEAVHKEPSIAPNPVDQAAETTYALFTSLVKSGFNEDQAMELLKTMLSKPSL